MSETWTEYAVRFPLGHISDPMARTEADNYVEVYNKAGIKASLVGRNVIASDWLPVDQGGAS